MKVFDGQLKVVDWQLKVVDWQPKVAYWQLNVVLVWVKLLTDHSRWLIDSRAWLIDSWRWVINSWTWFTDSSKWGWLCTLSYRNFLFQHIPQDLADFLKIPLGKMKAWALVDRKNLTSKGQTIQFRWQTQAKLGATLYISDRSLAPEKSNLSFRLFVSLQQHFGRSFKTV